MPDLALLDLIAPYVLLGDSFGQWHAALSTMYVDEHVVAVDSAGVVIRGVTRFSGTAHPFIDPNTMTFGIQAENAEGHPANDPGRREPWFDVRDAYIEFQLTAPRIASQKVAAAVTAIGGAAAFAQAASVLTTLDSNPSDPAPSDYPSTEFVLDLLLTAVVLRPPFLEPAKLQPNGQLVADTTRTDVTFTLPRIKVRLAQGSSLNDPLTVELMSAGASSLDDPADIGIAQFVTMEPPYAFIGPSHVVGFGFRSATLDLSEGSTPPEVLAQFGFDEAWTGLYLPDLRLFIAPGGANDLAIGGGAHNLLIGFGASAGITGDFDLELINQGSGTLHLGARFYDNAGRGYAITHTSDTEARVALPDHSRLVTDVDGGLAPYSATAAFDGGAPTVGRVFDVDLSAQASRSIMIEVTDSRPAPGHATLTISAHRLPAPTAVTAGSGGGMLPDTPAARVDTTSVTQAGLPVPAPRLRLVSETPTTATVALDVESAVSANWTVAGVDRGPGISVTLDLPQGTSSTIKAEVTGPSSASEFTAYYRFDHPPPGTNDQVGAYAQITDAPGVTRSTNTVPAVDQGLTNPWPGGGDAGSALLPILASLPAHTHVNISGFASYETGGQQKLDYNTALAYRRAIGLEAIIKAHAGGKDFDTDPKAEMTHWTPEEQGDPVRNLFWKAVASWTPQPLPGTTTEGVAHRPTTDPQPVVPVPVPDNPTAATPPPSPSWFRELGGKLRIVHSQFVACEVYGKFDIQTAAENQLRQGGLSDEQMPALRRLGSNPADGLIDVRIVIQYDDASDTVTVSGYFGADPADRDGLMMTGTLADEPPGASSDGRNYLGLAIVFMPLLSAASSAVAGDGALAEIGVTAAALAVPFGLAALGWVTVERVIWYGGELTFQHRQDGLQGVILLDLETAVSLKVALGTTPLLTIPPDAPLVVRYKAVGLLVGNPPGQPSFQFRPVFDASKGYTIDVSRPGAIQVVDPLGQILRILGARIARNNPLLFEVDLGFAIDLGVVSIDRARVRMYLTDPHRDPELTAFGAGVDIPGALKGRGYLEMSESEIKGQIDVTLVPVQLRIAAGLGVAHIDPDETAVIVTLEVDFPVAIPLANSGIGIYGFLGLFAMNYARDESISQPPADIAPALAWLRATGGDPANLKFWSPRLNTWAIGLGALLGTMGSSVIFNMKGIFLLELPGPRLLLMMKANLLVPMPEQTTPAEGMFLAVLDLDIGRGTLTIGLAIDFNVDPLLRLTIPVEAFFKFDDSSDWHLFVGQYVDQVQAKVLQIFDASGYLMLSGNGLQGIGNPTLPDVTGFSIATGLHVSFTWGGGPLYAQLAAGFDAILGFSPFRMAGTLTVRGTLHLFIVDISAWAELHVDVGEIKASDGSLTKIARISGDVCGRVEFLFFSIEGCVSFALGDGPGAIPDPPDLARSLKLISRSPALVLGTAVDQPVDGGIDNAFAGDAQPDDEKLPVVPIDAIPTLLLSQPPVADGLQFLNQPIGNTPEAPSDGWVQHGDVWLKYTLKQVELIGPLTTGKTPAVWWKPKSGSKAIEAQLALLSWVPEATPKAIGSSKYLDEMVKEHWGTVCQPAAPPTPVFWSFLQELLGPSPVGWSLIGTAWPDPPNTVRSEPAGTGLRVFERWRSGDPFIDKLRGIVAARVEGLPVACPDTLHPAPLHIGPGINPQLPPQLPAINPIAAIRGSGDVEQTSNETLTIIDVIQRFATGVPVGRAAMASLVPPASATTPMPSHLPGSCFGRALAAPIFDDGELVAFGNAARKDDIQKGWTQLKFKPGPLDDAVVVETGQFVYTRLYLYVPRQFLSAPVVVVTACDASDTLGPLHVVTIADRMPPVTFPSTWSAASGPWHTDVALLGELLALENDYVGVLVEIKGGPGMNRVQIGALLGSRNLRRERTFRPFYIAGIEVLRQSEVARFDYDTKEQSKKQGVLANALGLDSSDVALLEKKKAYQVRITWDAARGKRATVGAPVSDIQSFPDRTQSFWFRTNDKAPARLHPHVLAVLPGEGEQHVFAADLVKIVFASNNVNLLYDAYGYKLQARLKPASFRPVVPPPGVTHPIVLNGTTLKPVRAAVLSPWEEAVQALVYGTCVVAAGDRVRHSLLTVPIPLDLFTDYVLDIEMLDKAAPDGSPGTIVWRAAFSTGAFHTLDEFAESFRSARVADKGVHADDVGKLHQIGADFATQAPQGAQFDAALLEAGVDLQPVPKAPRAVIFWEPGTPFPQPVAIMLDASEPMWRWRDLPVQVTDLGLAAAKRFEMQPTAWLELSQQPGGSAIVESIVPAPGGQRALITLKPGSRGKQIRLALRRIALTEQPYLDEAPVDQFATVLDMQLLNAPWEEVD